ncbi:hypothetical protein ACFQY0_21015 [Haloferula chungangensis]|uniref:Uncharacterized protein n=1 Tax=Haloferula chungangensis TaxID=1048331 RepID=A0ABW2LE88_9BACT
MKTLVPVLLAVIMTAVSALADGIEMTGGFRFVSGTRLQIRLTAQQIETLEHQRKGEERLYTATLNLNESQSKQVHEKTGKVVTSVKVFERAWSDCGCAPCAANIASRFDPNMIEVTSDHLYDTAQVQSWFQAAKPANKPKKRSSLLRRNWKR